jgi:hypothetical protein
MSLVGEHKDKHDDKRDDKREHEHKEEKKLPSKIRLIRPCGWIDEHGRRFHFHIGDVVVNADDIKAIDEHDKRSYEEVK